MYGIHYKSIRVLNILLKRCLYVMSDLLCLIISLFVIDIFTLYYFPVSTNIHVWVEYYSIVFVLILGRTYINTMSKRKNQSVLDSFFKKKSKETSVEDDSTPSCSSMSVQLSGQQTQFSAAPTVEASSTHVPMQPYTWVLYIYYYIFYLCI